MTGALATILGTLNPLRYRSYAYDTETGYYYLQSRYYDPGIGRFINADALLAIGHGLLGNNLFAYCLNNPVSYADDTGTIPLLLVGIVAIALVGIIYGATTNRNLSETFSPQEEDKPDIIVRPAPAPRPEIKSDPSPSSPIVTFPTPPREEKSLQNTEHNLTTKERINNIIIGGTVGLMIGGAAAFIGVAAACVAGYSSVLLPVLGVTGKQAVAWGLLSYDVFPIFIAPLLGTEMEVLEYPS